MAFHPAARADQQELLDVGLLRNGAGDVDIGRDDIALDGPRRSDPDRLSGDVALHHAVDNDGVYGVGYHDGHRYKRYRALPAETH